jgi:hypothetical protein
MLTGKFVVSGCFGAILGVLAGPAVAQNSQGGGGGGCNAIPNLGKLKSALRVRGPRHLNSRFRYEESQFVPQRYN